MGVMRHRSALSHHHGQSDLSTSESFEDGDSGFPRATYRLTTTFVSRHAAIAPALY
jgi:hypothetical protein